jgi:phage gp36-like protein
MGYITNTDVELRLGTTLLIQLTDDVESGQVNTDVADEARLGCEGEVNSFLARRYGVPIDLGAHPQVADLLRTVTLDLAEYRLHARRPPVPAEVIARQKGALAWLGKAASGEVILPTLAPVAPNPASGVAAAITGNAKGLSANELKGL